MFITFQTFFAFTALISSLLVITSKNPVISILFLISVFVNSAIYLMFLGVNFIGISYIIVYVGAIAILFLFILMMINIKLTDILEVGTEYTRNLPLATFIAAIFIFGIFGSFSSSTALAPLFSVQDTLTTPFIHSLNLLNLLATTPNNGIGESLYLGQDIIKLATIDSNGWVNEIDVDSSLDTFTQVQALGFDLYTHNGPILILMSLILLLSMLAPILLSNFYNNDR